jgi:sulfite reductase alpha subunit-like flavoprotein
MTRTTLLYASETGTAEDVAYSIYNKLSDMYSNVEIANLTDYNFLERLPAETFVVFIVSTTGEGDCPLGMKKFWNFLLRKSLPKNSLENLSFTVFGLGDSGYDKYNATGRRLNVRLKQLGAKEVITLGLGDDQAVFGYLVGLNKWSEQLFSYLASCIQKVADDKKGASLGGQVYLPYDCTFVDETQTESLEKVDREIEHAHEYFSRKSPTSPVLSTVLTNTRMTWYVDKKNYQS